jgi:dTDP-4-amino-4,6-dideoxygalactose transaminase
MEESRDMSVPFFDMRRHLAPMRAEIDRAIRQVLDEGEFIQGHDVGLFERDVARWLSASGAVGVSSGTDALLVALMALGAGPGTEVVTTPYTFFATAGAIARVGARPVFADIDPETFNLDPAKALDRVGIRTRAILPVHLFGHMAELRPLLELAGARGVSIVEDAAQAIGAACGLGKAGTLGTAAAFSFFPSKNLGGIGDGGMVTSMNEPLLDQVRLLRNHGAAAKYRHVLVGGNFRLDTIQAAVLRVKLKHLESWTGRRRALAARYRTLFGQAGVLDDVTLPVERPGFRHAYNQFVVRACDRDGLIGRLRERGVGHAVYYPAPLHLQACFASLGYREGAMPEAERACRETVALPIFPELTDPEQEEVVGVVADFLRGGRAGS